MSHDGLIGLDNAIQAYQTSAIHVRDENMSRSKTGITDWSNKGCGGTFGNYLDQNRSARVVFQLHRGQARRMVNGGLSWYQEMFLFVR